MAWVLANPLSDPNLMPTAIRLGGLFLVALLGILVVVKGRLDALGSNVLYQRWRTWAMIAPLYLMGALSGGLPATLFTLLLTFQGAREFAHLTALPKRYRSVLYGMSLLPAPIALLSLDLYYALPPLLLIVATAQPLLFRESAGVRHLAFAALGWGYIAWFLSHFVLITRWVDGGPGIILVMGAAIAMSDIGAFVFGKAMGRHKMAPRVSPNKTWEGAIGNVVGAAAALAIFAYALPGALRWELAILLPGLVAVGAVWGDLVESAIKREFAVKDAGAWLPGFGGLLDRIDSLLIVLPLTYYPIRLLS